MDSSLSRQREDVEKSCQDQSSVDRVLKTKRKPRVQTACYPCRHRKVRCDLSRPCKTCRDRDHPDLCTYQQLESHRRYETDDIADVAADVIFDLEPAPSDAAHHLELLAGRVQILENDICERLNRVEDSVQTLRQELQARTENIWPSFLQTHERSLDLFIADIPLFIESHIDMHIPNTENLSNEAVLLQDVSVPLSFHSIDEQGFVRDQLPESISLVNASSLDLDSEAAAYPFADSWAGSDTSIEMARSLAEALPTKSHVLILFRNFRDLSDLIYPCLADIVQFERDLDDFSANRDSNSCKDEGISTVEMYGKDFHWLALLFAVLASGTQVFQPVTRGMCEERSKRYICCSFACLRFTRFLDVPIMEDIQALALIGFVMSNNMSTDTAGSLIGLTKRLAQSIDLHRAFPLCISHDFIYLRSKVWWSIVWQDSLLSLSCVKHSTVDTQSPHPPQTWGPVPAYHAAMYHLSRIGLAIILDRSQITSLTDQFAIVQDRLKEIDAVIIGSDRHLQNVRHCSTSRQHVEYWSYCMHSNYVTSALLRPMISQANTNYGLSQQLQRRYIDSLVDTVEGFLELTNFAVFARYAWDTVHRGVSSALLLSNLGEHLHNAQARVLIIRVITLMDSVILQAPADDWRLIVQAVEALKHLRIGAPLLLS